MEAESSSKSRRNTSCEASVSRHNRRAREAGLNPVQHAAHVILFWVLASLAFAVFAPCVLVPIWMETEQLHERVATVGQHLNAQREILDNTNRQIAALAEDPLVNERLVRRELNYRSDDEQLIRWSPEQLSATRIPRAVLPFAETDSSLSPRPPWMESLVRWLPNWPWKKLFGQQHIRTLLMIMSGGLLAAGFVLYGPAIRLPGSKTSC